MSKLTDEEKIKRLKSLYDSFHSKMAALSKRQLKLLDKARKLVEKKKLKEIRDEIKKN